MYNYTSLALSCDFIEVIKSFLYLKYKALSLAKGPEETVIYVSFRGPSNTTVV